MIAHLLCLAAISTHGADGLRACALAVPVAVASERHGHDPRTLMAIGWVESRWHVGAIGTSGETGPWQVLPRYQQSGGDADDAARMLARWKVRSRGALVPALRAYNAGNKGLSGVAGNAYAARVVAVMEGWQWQRR